MAAEYRRWKGWLEEASLGLAVLLPFQPNHNQLTANPIELTANPVVSLDHVVKTYAIPLPFDVHTQDTDRQTDTQTDKQEFKKCDFRFQRT